MEPRTNPFLPDYYPVLPRLVGLSVSNSSGGISEISECFTECEEDSSLTEESSRQVVAEAQRKSHTEPPRKSRSETPKPPPALLPREMKKIIPTCPSKEMYELDESLNEMIQGIMDKNKHQSMNITEVGERRVPEKRWHGWVILNEFKPFILATHSQRSSSSEDIPEPDDVESDIIHKLLVSSRMSVFKKQDSTRSFFKRMAKKTGKHFSMSDVKKYNSTFVRQESGLSADLKELHQSAGDAGTNVPTLFKEVGSQASSTQIRLFDVTTTKTSKNACLLKEADRERLYLMFTPSDENILEIVNNIQIRNKILRHDVGNIVLKIKLSDSQKNLFKTCTKKQLFPQNKLPSIVPVKIRQESSFQQEIPITDETLYEKYYLDYTIEKNGYYILVRERPLLVENIRLSVVPKMSIQKAFKDQTFSPHHSRKNREVAYGPTIKIQSDTSVGAFKKAKKKKVKKAEVFINQFNEEEIIKSIMDNTILDKAPCNEYIEVCLSKVINRLKEKAGIIQPEVAKVESKTESQKEVVPEVMLEKKPILKQRIEKPLMESLEKRGSGSETMEEESKESLVKMSKWDEMEKGEGGEKARNIRDRLKGIRRKLTLLLPVESSEIITSDELLLLNRNKRKETRKSEVTPVEKVYDETKGFTKSRPSKFALDHLDEVESVVDTIDAIEHEMKATRVNVDCKMDPVEEAITYPTEAETGKKCIFLDRFQQYKSILHTDTKFYRHEPTVKLKGGECMDPIIAGQCWREVLSSKCDKIPNELLPYGIYYKPITTGILDEVRHELGVPTFTYAKGTEEFKGLAPSSALKNSEKELVLLNYCDHFLRKYYSNNLGRQKLFLCALNEFGVQKVVSTSLSPTQISYQGMDDWKNIAKFVSNNLHFVSLRIPTALPHDLKSASYVLRKGEGSPFELSNVLASLLIGVGYNAVVVSGYASIMLTEIESHHNYPRNICPYLLDTAPTDPFEVFPTKAQAKKEAERNYKEIKFDNRYAPVTQAYLGSKYLQELDEIEIEENLNEDNRIRKEIEEASIKEFEQQFEIDEIEGKRLHSWVAVLPGMRGVSSPFFIEPATSLVYQVDDGHYFGIESVWNHQNYWINRNFTKLEETIWDLSNTDYWIPLLSNGPLMMYPKTKLMTKRYLNNQENLDMPQSWAPKIGITNKQMERRIHEVYKLRVYRKSVCFDYQPGANDIGLVSKVISFNDFEKLSPQSTTELFEKRSDNLYRRIKNMAVDNVIEHFSFGRPDCLRTHKYLGGQRKIFHDHEIEFYSDSRPDGLTTIELTENRMTLTFSGRKDSLKRVKVVYGRYLKATIPNTQTFTKEIVMVSQEFDRSPAIPPWEDIALVIFRLKKNDIIVYYHFELERISQMVRIIYKPDVNDQEEVLVTGNWKETNAEEDDREHMDIEDHGLIVEESVDKALAIERDDSLPNIYQYKSERSCHRNDIDTTMSSAVISSISKESMESVDSSQSFAAGQDDLECVGDKVPTLFPAILTADKDKLMWACAQKKKFVMEDLQQSTLKTTESLITKRSGTSNTTGREVTSTRGTPKSMSTEPTLTSIKEEEDEEQTISDEGSDARSVSYFSHKSKGTFMDKSFDFSRDDSLKPSGDTNEETYGVKINEFDHFTRESSRASTNEEEEYIRELYTHHLHALGEIRELAKETARGECNPDVEFIVGLISVPKNSNICQCKLDKFYARLANIFQENPIHYKSSVEKSHKYGQKVKHNKSILVPDDINPKAITSPEKAIEETGKQGYSVKNDVPETDSVNRRTYKNCIGCKTSDELINKSDKRDWNEFHGFESIADDLREYLLEESKKKTAGNKGAEGNAGGTDDKFKADCVATCDCSISETESGSKCDLKRALTDDIIEQKKAILERALILKTEPSSLKPDASGFKNTDSKLQKSSTQAIEDDEEYIDLFSKTDQEIDEIILNLQDDLVRCRCEDKKNETSFLKANEKKEKTYDIQDRYNCSCCKKECEMGSKDQKKEKNVLLYDEHSGEFDEKEADHGLEIDVSDGTSHVGVEKDEDSIEGDDYLSDNNYSQVTSRAASSECLSGMTSSETSISCLSQSSTLETQGAGKIVHEPYNFQGFHYNAGKMNVRKLYQVKEVCDSTLVESDNDSEQGEEDEYDLKFLEREIDKFLTNTIDRSQEQWQEARKLIGVLKKGFVDANHISSFYCTINDQYINYVDAYFKKINKNREMQTDKSFVNELKKKKAKEAGKIINNLKNYFYNLKHGLPAKLDDELMHLIPHIRPVITKKKDRLGYEILDDSDDNELNPVDESGQDDGSLKEEVIYDPPLSVTLKTEELLNTVADTIQQRAVSRAIKKFERFKAVEEGLLGKSLETSGSDINLKDTLKNVSIYDGYFLDSSNNIEPMGIIKNDVQTDISFITEVESIPLFKTDAELDEEEQEESEIVQEEYEVLRHMEALNACGKERFDEAEYYENVYTTNEGLKRSEYSDIGIETFRLFQPLPKNLLESDSEGSICDRIRKKRRKVFNKDLIVVDKESASDVITKDPSSSISDRTHQESEIIKARALAKQSDISPVEENEFKMDFFKKCRLLVKNASSNEDMSNIKRAEIMIKFFTLEQEAVSYVRQQEYWIHNLLDQREEENSKATFTTLISSKVSIRKAYYLLLRKKLNKWYKIKDMLSFNYDLLKPYLHLLTNDETPKKLTYETADYIVRCIILDFIERDIFKIKRMFQAYEKARELAVQKINYFENVLHNFSITGPDHFNKLVYEYNKLLMQIADKAHIIRFQIARYTKLSTKRFKALLARLSEDKRIRKVYDMARERIIQMDLMKRWPEFFEKTTHFLGLPVPSEPNDIATSYMSPTYELIMRKIANRVRKRPARYNYTEDTYYKFCKLMDEEGDYFEELESKEWGEKEVKKEKRTLITISPSEIAEGVQCQEAKDKNTIFIDKPEVVNNLNWYDFYLISNVFEEPTEKIVEEETLQEIQEEETDFRICTEAIIEEIILLKHLMDLQDKVNAGDSEAAKELQVVKADDLEVKHKQRDLIYVKHYGTPKHKEVVENQLIKFFERA